jgi:WD40 repeat protein
MVTALLSPFSGGLFMTTGVSTPRAGVNGDSLASAMADDEAAAAQSVVIGGGVDHGAVVAGHHNTVTVNNYTVHELRTVEGAAPTSIGPNPYRGLLAFRTVDRANFFGRGLDVERLVDAFHRAQKDRPGDGPLRFVAILGPSGSGKSSLALAGLVPRLAETPPPGFEGARVEVLTPGSAPLALLEERSRPGDGEPLILVVDQLEEAFTLCKQADERLAFFARMLALASDRQRRIAVVITLRTDFLVETRAYPDLDRAIADAGVLIPSMGEAQLREAIEGPARNAGRPFDEAVVQLLLSQAGDSDGALPLLSHALASIWIGLAAGVAPAETLKAIGGVGGALAGTAEAIFSQLDPAAQSAARRVFLRLVKIDASGKRDARRRITRADLVSRDPALDAIVEDVIRRFADARLLTLSSDDGRNETVEVSHEALFRNWKRLKEWIATDRAELLLQQRLREAIDHWNETNRAPGQLWRSPDLELLEALHRRAGGDLGAAVDAFLTASAEQRDRERAAAAASQLARRRLGVALAFAGIIAVAAGGIGVFWRRAERNARTLYREEGRHAALVGDGPRALAYLGDVYRSEPRDVALRFLVARSAAAIEARVQVFDVPGANFAALSPDGKLVVTAGQDGQATLWNAATGRPGIACSHATTLSTATFSADGALLVTASDDGARLWDVQTGALVRHFTSPTKGHVGDVLSAVLSRDGRRLVTTGKDHTARLWDATTGEVIRVFAEDGHTDEVLFAAIRSDGALVATAGRDGLSIVWDALTGQVVQKLVGHTGLVRSVDFSPDGGRIVTASADRSAVVWSVATGSPIVTLGEHDGEVVFAAFSPEGERIVTASGDAARIWDASRRRLIASFRGAAMIRSAAFSADGAQVITANLAGPSELWSAFDGRLLSIQSATGGLVAAAWSPDGRSFVTAGRQAGTQLWSATSGDLDAEIAVGAARITSLAWSVDGKRFVTGGSDGRAAIWDAATRALLIAIPASSAPLGSVAWSPDGRRLVTASADLAAGHEEHPDPIVRIWDTTTGAAIGALGGHAGPVYSAVYSVDGKRLVTAGSDGTARIWGAETTKLELVIPGRVARYFASFSPDGKRVVLADGDGQLEVCDARTGAVKRLFTGHSNVVYRARYSADGARIVSAGKDGTARIWDAERGALLATLAPHGNEVTEALFDPSGERVLSVSLDGLAKVWDTHVEARTPKKIESLARCRVPYRLAGGDLVASPLDPARCADAATIARPAPDLVRADALRSPGWWASGSTEAAAAVPRIQEALAIFRTAGNHREEAATLSLLRNVERAARPGEVARPDLDRAREGLQRATSPRDQAIAYRELAAAELAVGTFAATEGAAAAAFASSDEHGARALALANDLAPADPGLQIELHLALVHGALARADTLSDAARASRGREATQHLDAVDRLLGASATSVTWATKAGILAARGAVLADLDHDPRGAHERLDEAYGIARHDAAVLASRIEVYVALGRFEAALDELPVAIAAQRRPEMRAYLAALGWVAAVLDARFSIGDADLAPERAAAVARWAAITREACGLLPPGRVVGIATSGVRHALVDTLKIAGPLRDRLVSVLALFTEPVADDRAGRLAKLLEPVAPAPR